MTTTTVEVIPADQRPEASPARKPKLKRRGRVAMWLSILWLVFLTVSAVGADYVPWVKSDTCASSEQGNCANYEQSNIRLSGRPPSWASFAEPERSSATSVDRYGLMGTDENGRDIFSRAMVGARASLTIGGLAIVFGLFLGTVLGLLAGYLRGWVDRVIETISNIMLAFPALLLAIFLVTFLSDPSTEAKRSITPVIVSLAILSVPPLTRLVRANTIAYSEREFVMAARSMGAKPFRVVFREILPNIVPTLLSFALTGLAILIVAEGALAFIGLSVEAPTPSWGTMIQVGVGPLRNGSWWISIMPALVVFLTILSVNFLGDVIAQRFNVREAIG